MGGGIDGVQEDPLKGLILNSTADNKRFNGQFAQHPLSSTSRQYDKEPLLLLFLPLPFIELFQSTSELSRLLLLLLFFQQTQPEVPIIS